jgi:hypothetical protein
MHRPAEKLRASKACRQRPASPFWCSVNVVVDLAGKILRKLLQLPIGYHPTQALRDWRDAWHFSRRPAPLPVGRRGGLCLSRGACHDNLRIPGWRLIVLRIGPAAGGGKAFTPVAESCGGRSALRYPPAGSYRGRLGGRGGPMVDGNGTCANNYSYLSAIVGSTRIARRAGM